LRPNPACPPAPLRLHAASARIDITPQRPVALAGFVSRTAVSGAVASPLEASALVLQGGSVHVLIVTADLLYFGPVLTRRLRAQAARHGFAADQLVLAASHTHFAPATDAAKPQLGRVDDDMLTWIGDRLCDLVDQVAGSALQPVTLRRGSVDTDVSVHRRRRWPWPTWTRAGLRAGPSIVMAPNPSGPRDPRLDALVVEGESGQALAVLWKLACHPVCFPALDSICAEFPGHARALLRQRLGAGLPVLFLQGFTGDVRPDLRAAGGRWNWLNTLRRGPSFGEVSMGPWQAWADRIGKALLGAVAAAEPCPHDGDVHVARVELPLAEIVDGKLNPALAGRTVALQRLSLGAGLDLVFVEAEVCAPYLDAFGAPQAICVGYTGDVFGYLPTEAQVAEGGYEGGGFMATMDLAGGMVPGFERAVRAAARELMAHRAAGSMAQPG
jgi:hypothetical protein